MDRSAYSALPLLMLLIISSTGASLLSTEKAEIISENDALSFQSGIGDLHLIENRGQLDRDDILFYTTGSIRYALGDGFMQIFMNENDAAISSIRIDLIDANMNGMVYGPEEETVYNHFQGSSPEHWISEVQSYQWITLKNIYNEIDMKVYPEGGGLKYDLIVNPGGDPSDISIRYTGADTIEVMDSVMIKATCGSIDLTDGPLVVFQKDKRPVRAGYMIDGDTLTYDIGSFDRGQDLIIDPLVLASTYLGGNDWDVGQRVAVDDWGRPYVACTTDSTNFPTTAGAYSTLRKGETDIVVSRFSEDLSSLQISTYIGGTDYDTLMDITIADDDRIFISGSSNSTNFPTTAGCYIRNAPSGKNGFITALDPTLDSLDYSTYIGGGSSDIIRDIAVDTSGNAYATGTTRSADLPTSTGAYQESMNGTVDCFITKISADGSSMIYSSFIGGSTFGEDAYTIVVDTGGRATIAGNSIDGEYPTTVGAYKRGTGYYAGFLTRFTSDGSGLDFSTFYANGTWIYSMDIGPGGDFFITGMTRNEAGDFPVTENAHDRSITGEVDAFIGRISSDGSSNVFTTFLGADEEAGNPPNQAYIESGLDIAAATDGRAYVCGHTDSNGFPVTIGAFDARRNGQDGFITVISTITGTVDYSSFIGGSVDDEVTGLSMNSSNGMFIAGNTYSNYPSHDFPTTEGAYDTSFQSGYDGFVIRYKLDSYVPDTPRSPQYFSEDSFINLSWSEPDYDGGEPIDEYRISRGTSINDLRSVGGSPPTDLFFNDTTAVNGVDYIYRIRAVNAVGAGPGVDINATATTSPGPPVELYTYPGNHHLNLTWRRPMDDGGIQDIVYSVLLGNTSDDLMIIGSDLSENHYNITGLKNGNRYFMAVFATNERGTGPLSDIISDVPLDVPSPPINLRYDIEPFKVRIDWDPPLESGGSDNITYRVYSGDNLSSAEERSSSSYITGIVLSESRIGEPMFYYVKAENELGLSKRSEILEIAPLGDMSAPYGLTAIEKGTHINLTWQPPDLTGGAADLRYDILFGTNWSDLSSKVESIEGTSFDMFDVLQGATYYFKVRANNSFFTGPLSEIASAIPFTVPSRPLNLTATHGDEKVSLKWEAPIDNGGDGNFSYEVLMGDRTGILSPWKMVGGNRTIIDSLKNGVYYFFSVRAVNLKGSGDISNEVIARPMGIPGKPRELHYSEGDGYLNFTWEEPVDDGGSFNITYHVYFGTDRLNLSILYENVSFKQVNITGLTNGVMYHIYLVALNEEGVSERSDIIPAKPLTIPTAPVITNLTYSIEGVLIRWEPPQDDGGGEIWYYNIYRGQSAGEMELIEITGGSILSYLDMDVDPDIMYYYSISAETSKGVGPMSESKMIDTSEVTETIAERDLTFLLVVPAGLILILLIVLIIVMISRRRKKRAMRIFFEE